MSLEQEVLSVLCLNYDSNAVLYFNSDVSVWEYKSEMWQSNVGWSLENCFMNYESWRNSQGKHKVHHQYIRHTRGGYF